jgi:hypothetical protein
VQSRVGYFAGLEVLTAVTRKTSFFWVVDLVVRGQPDVSEEHVASSSGSKPRFSLPPASAGFLLGLLFGHDDGGGMFLQNDGLSPDYMALQPIIP